MSLFTFKKTERLKSRITIGRLFKEGQSFSKYPIRIVFVEAESDVATTSSAQFTVSVPKRNFKRAVQRNQIRRRIQEAYRLNKIPLLEQLEKTDKRLSIMFIYVGKKAFSYQQIEQSMQKILRQLVDKIG